MATTVQIAALWPCGLRRTARCHEAHGLNRDSVKGAPKAAAKPTRSASINLALTTVYEFKDDLKALWNCRDSGYAKRFWQDWHERAINSEIGPLGRCATTRVLAQQQVEISAANQGLLEAKGLTREHAMKLIDCVQRVDAKARWKHRTRLSSRAWRSVWPRPARPNWPSSA